MNRIKIKSLLSAASVLFLTVSCTGRFEEYNTDPYGVIGEELMYDGLKYGAPLAQMQRNIMPYSQQPSFGDEKYQVVQNLCGDIFSGMMAAPRYWQKNADNTTYALYSNWYSQPFDHAYTNIMAPWNDLRKKCVEDDMPQIYAIAQIIKIEAMHRVTDLYGPLPYSRFGEGTQVNYDSQEAIYNSFFRELDSAVVVLNDYAIANPGSKILTAFDYIYQGEPAQWVKFANSLRLRLALRLHFVDAVKAQAEATAALDPANGGVMTSVADNAKLVNGRGVSFHHPLNEICDGFNDVRMGATMDCYMNGYGDPRRSAYFKLPDETSALANVSLYPGVRTGIDIGSDDANYKAYAARLNIARGADIVWMASPEVCFLQAEAKIRYDIGTTDAQTLYERGIDQSMEMWGVTAGGSYKTVVTAPRAYYDPVRTGNNTGAPSTVTVAWANLTTDAAKLEGILTQKWIALYPDGVEGWSEFRRTGYPKVIPVAVNNSNGTISTATQICRLPYPTSEKLNNADGLATGVTLLGGADNGGTKLWWDKN
ncbi:MAG: SusD/RagB family nutrient-binding outer membrane lipoprotein [Rikenellaceae bacterium]|jgi:hypothetical protein|nr:SusD/RagB family nutrient-binding outer membrane lipoprotein [Rikenellaceae bacterium]